jgi:hypothetical protein
MLLLYGLVVTTELSGVFCTPYLVLHYYCEVVVFVEEENIYTIPLPDHFRTGEIKQVYF